MLEGLDQVDWAHLWACSPATEIPQLIRTLAFAADHELRKRTIRDLSERLLYQDCSILEVTAPAVPFVLEVLTAEPVQEKADLLLLLVSIARGNPFITGTAAFVPYTDEASVPPELQASLAEQQRWVQRAHEAVEHGVPTYLTFLAHPAAEARRWTANLLSHFPTQAPVILPALQMRLDHEDDHVVQATIMLSLAALLNQTSNPDSEATSAFLQRVSSYVRAQVPLLLRCTAALASARCAPAATPPHVVQVLVEAAAAADALDTSYWQLPEGVLENNYSVTTWLCKTLALIEPTQAVPALTAVLHRLPFADGNQPLNQCLEILKTVEVLLGAVFSQGAAPGGEQGLPLLPHLPALLRAGLPAPPALRGMGLPAQQTAATLSQPQRLALSALVAYDPLWTMQPASAKHRAYVVERGRHDLLERYGLPTSRDACRTLLE
jgi:hypothetical protein